MKPLHIIMLHLVGFILVFSSIVLQFITGAYLSWAIVNIAGWIMVLTASILRMRVEKRRNKDNSELKL